MTEYWIQKHKLYRLIFQTISVYCTLCHLIKMPKMIQKTVFMLHSLLTRQQSLFFSWKKTNPSKVKYCKWFPVTLYMDFFLYLSDINISICFKNLYTLRHMRHPALQLDVLTRGSDRHTDSERKAVAVDKSLASERVRLCIFSAQKSWQPSSIPGGLETSLCLLTVSCCQ